ncbi:MAG: hypothetical protein FH761_05940 [Firmicutes bacterium]|nr:hypothetical protein [Bacillota bacterium]
MRKMLAFTIIISVVALALIGCNQETVNSNVPKNFSFVLEYGVKGGGSNVLNTSEGTFEKDTVDGQIKTKLVLKEEDMQKIYDKIKELDLEEYPMGFKRRRSGIEPSGEWSLNIQYSGKEKYIAWTSNAFPPIDIESIEEVKKLDKTLAEMNIEKAQASGDEKLVKLYRIQELVHMITDIISGYDEYKELPESRRYL